MNTNLGIISQDAATLNAILAAVNLAGVTEAPPVPAGELGGCVACGHTVGSHFSNGAWVGCLKGSASTVFILVPAPVKPGAAGIERRGRTVARDTATAQEFATAEPTPEPQHAPRMARRLRYTSAVDRRKSIDKLPLTETRRKVLKAIHNAPGKHGVLAKQVMARTRLPHGTIQQTLNWLRSQKEPFVIAHDANAAQ